MNTQKIQEAFDILKDALADEADSVTLKWTVSKRDLGVLRFICRLNVTIPSDVNQHFPGVKLGEVEDVLNSLGTEIDRLSK